MAATPTEILSERAHEIDKRLTTHEAVCAQRYENIESGMTRLDERISMTNSLLLTVAGATVLQLLAVLGYLLVAYAEAT